MFTLNWQPPQTIYSTPASGIALQPLMRQVYIWMGLGTLLTAGAAYYTLHSSLLTLALQPGTLLVALLVELGLVLGLSFGLRRISPTVAVALFFVYAAVNGFTLSVALFAVGLGTAFTAFLTTAALFGVMSVFAFTTTMDLTRIGTYLIIGVIGLVIAMVINVFLASSALDLLISLVGVVIFTGLTAYDTQRIGQMAASMGATKDDNTARFAIFGALKLYLDFINLFLFLLRLMGGGRRR